MVLHTLEKSFNQCLALHDLFEPFHEDKYATEFANIVSGADARVTPVDSFCEFLGILLYFIESTTDLPWRPSTRFPWLSSTAARSQRPVQPRTQA